MNYLRQPEKTPSAPKRDDLSAGGERRERGRVEREVDMVLLTRLFCAQSRSTRHAVVPSFVFNTLTHTDGS